MGDRIALLYRPKVRALGCFQPVHTPELKNIQCWKGSQILGIFRTMFFLKSHEVGSKVLGPMFRYLRSRVTTPCTVGRGLNHMYVEAEKP